MKTVIRLLKTNPGLSLMLCLIAASSVYLSIPEASADKRSADKPKAKTSRPVKGRRAAVSRARKQPPFARRWEAPDPLEWFAPAVPTTTAIDELISDGLIEGRDKQPKRADEPDKAIQYFLQKRLPEGETDLPVERYFEAMEEMKRMSLHSTADNRLFSREELRNLGPDQPRLGAWTALGPGNIGGRTRAILINPQDPNVMYAAGVAGGVWKTTNAGQSWTPLADMIANIAVCSMAFDSKNPNVIYAGTGEGFGNGDSVRGAGIFKTADAGQTWTRLASTANNTNFFFVNDLVVSANDSNRIYAATSTGVWRATDGGETWTRVVVTTGGGGCHDLAARTDQPTDFLMAACGNSAQATVYRKTDAEAAGTWEAVLSDPGMGRTALAFAPSNQNIVYAVSAAFTGTYIHALHAVFRSESGGAGGSWASRVRNTDANKFNTAILSNPPFATGVECKNSTGDSFSGQSWYDLAIAVDPLDAERVWVGGIDVARSDDGGANWGLAAFVYESLGGSLIYSKPNQLHPDQHFFTFHPQYNGTSNQQMFVGNDGGLWRTDNARAAVSTGPRGACDPAANKVRWSPLNNNYGVTQFYHGSVYPDGKSYLGGTQDNGTPRGSDAEGPNNWKQIFLADGGYSAVDFTNPNTLYVSTQGGGFRKSTDNGATFSIATLGLAGAVLFITPMAMDSSDPQRLYTGGDQLFRTNNGMLSWTNAGSLRNTTLTTGTLSALAIAPTDANHALFALNDGSIVRTTRALALGPTNPLSSTVERVTRPRLAFVSWLAFDPNDKNIAYATYSTFGGPHVFRTTNGGESWTNIDGAGATGIPDIPVHCLVVDTSNTARLYVGTDLGVFVSIDGGATWAVENTGFANVVTESLALNPTGGVTTLYAFTHGRGAYKVTANMSGCNFSLAEIGRTVAASGAELTVDVNVTPAGCNWQAESNASWITVQPGAGGSTNGRVGLKVEANNSIGRRFGTVAIAGRSFTVTQEGLSDLESPTLRITTPTTTTVNTNGGTVNVAGTATDNVRLASVTWRSNRGLSGAATGTTSWTIVGLPVLTGRNEITVTAADEAGNVSNAGALIVNSMPVSVLTTVAGAGAFGFSGDSGLATAAAISRPIRMAFDAAGALFFADIDNQRIRRVTPNGVITTVAGTGTAGFSGDGGPATAARLNGPLGVSLDKDGNLYIADGANHRIRKVTAATGVITTVAGTGVAGFSGDNGPAASALINAPENVFVDKDGNLFIADFSNHRIRKVTASSGVITTVAGDGVAGFSGDGGPATAAALSSPTDVVVDEAGNIYLCATGNARIRRVNASDGVITTVAGNGNTAYNGDGIPATAAALSNPQSIAFDPAGNLHIVDRGNARIRRVAASNGVISTIAGGASGFAPDGSAASGARLGFVTGVAIDPLGGVFISDRDNFRIRRIIDGLSGDNIAPTVAITAPTSGATFNATSNPLSLSGTANDNGAVALVRWSNDRGGSGAANGAAAWSIPAVALQPGVNNLTITAWDVSGNASSAQLAVSYMAQQVIVTIAGTGAGAPSGDGGPGTAAAVWQPRGVVADAAGNVIFTDNINRRARRIAPNGVITAFAGTGELGSSGDGGPATAATFNAPTGIAIDGAGNVYISDSNTHRVRRVAPNGVITTVAGTGVGFGGYSGDGGLAKDAELAGPQGLATDKDGNLYIADRNNNRIRKVTVADGKITTIAGTGLLGYSGDGGPAMQADLGVPTGVAVDAAGAVYIADQLNQRIRRVAPGGVITTIAGTGAAGFSGDGGPATSAQINLSFPSFLTVDAAGDVYFADRNNHRIRKLTVNTGIITTVAGTGVSGFNGDGTAPTGTALASPTGVAVDAAGNLFIADNLNNRVRRTRPASALRTLATVSAASFSAAAGLAPEEIAVAFGANLASATASATTLPLPTTLAGATVRVTDNVGVERLAPLFFVSADQINYLVPSGTANGIATVTVTNAAGEVSTGTVTISNVAPSLFAANANGSGVAAAVVFRRTASGQDSFEPVARFDSATNRFVAAPIDLGPEGEQVFLILFGTGFRGLSGLANVRAAIGGVNAPVTFAGAAPGLIGADQANLRIDRSLAGRGEVDVVLIVDDKMANTMRVAFR